jgi:acyl dehydratase
MNEPTPVYYEDIVFDETRLSSRVTFERDDIVAFARQWDPLPPHLDEAAAIAAGLDGLTASGTHMLAIKQRLLHEFGVRTTVIASFGSDEVRYKAAARPGDTVHLRFRWIEKRLSGSRPNCGIARHLSELTREDGKVLLSIYETILIRRRSAGADETNPSLSPKEP